MRRRCGAVAGLALVGLALVAVHAPPRAARAQQSGSPGQRPMGALWNSVAGASSSGVFAVPLVSYACVSSLSQHQAASVMRIGLSLKVTGVLYVTETSGATTQTTALNGGTAIPANQDYAFVREIRSCADDAGLLPLQFNFVLGTNGGLNYLRVTECGDGVD